MQLTQPTTTDGRRHSIKCAMSCDRFHQVHNQFLLLFLSCAIIFLPQFYLLSNSSQTLDFYYRMSLFFFLHAIYPFSPSDSFSKLFVILHLCSPYILILVIHIALPSASFRIVDNLIIQTMPQPFFGVLWNLYRTSRHKFSPATNGR